MAFQQARPYDTGGDALGTMYDIQKLVSGQQHNRLADLEFQQNQLKVERANAAYQAQQSLLNGIKDPNQRLAAIMAPDKFASSIFRDPKDRYLNTTRGLYDLQAPGGPAIVGGQRGYTFGDGTAVPTGGAGANLAGAAPPQAASTGPLDFRTARRRFEGGASGSAAPNPNSTAQGPDQFIQSTWERLMLTHGRGFIDTKIGPNADLNDPKVKAAIQELRNDEEVSGAMAEVYGQENAKELSSAGIEASPRNLVVAHFLGGSGAKKFLSADPNAPAAQFVDPAALTANKSVFFDQSGRPRTVGEVLGEVDRRIGDVSGQGATAQASATASGNAAADNAYLVPVIDPNTGEYSKDFGWNPHGIDPRTGRPGRMERFPSRAAQTNVNIDQKTADTELVKDRVDRLKDLRGRNATAERLLPELDMLEQQLSQLSVQGPNAALVYQVAGTAATIGKAIGVDPVTMDNFTKAVLNVDSKDQAAATTVEKLVNDFVANSLRSNFAGLGGASNMDVAMQARTQPSLNNPTAANLYLIQKVLRPQLERDQALWREIAPLQGNAQQLAQMDTVEADFNRRWAEAHPHAKPEQPTATATPAPVTQAPPVTQAAPGPAQPPPNTTGPYTPERMQQIQKDYPQAKQAPDGKFYTPNPAFDPNQPISEANPKYFEVTP